MPDFNAGDRVYGVVPSTGDYFAGTVSAHESMAAAISGRRFNCRVQFDGRTGVVDWNTAQLVPMISAVAAMREWIADCEWGDLTGPQAARLSTEQVIEGVAQHFDGGVGAFLATCL